MIFVLLYVLPLFGKFHYGEEKQTLDLVYLVIYFSCCFVP